MVRALGFSVRVGLFLIGIFPFAAGASDCSDALTAELERLNGKWIDEVRSRIGKVNLNELLNKDAKLAQLMASRDPAARAVLADALIERGSAYGDLLAIAVKLEALRVKPGTDPTEYQRLSRLC